MNHTDNGKVNTYEPAPKIGAPRKQNGLKKTQVTASLEERVVEFYGSKIKTARKAEELINKAYAKESKAAKSNG